MMICPGGTHELHRLPYLRAVDRVERPRDYKAVPGRRLVAYYCCECGAWQTVEEAVPDDSTGA
jgi:hypothetical protein